jgi:hypothetical protein
MCSLTLHVVLLVIFITSRPHAGDSNKPIQHGSLVQAAKHIDEGPPDEVQTVLGWVHLTPTSFSFSSPLTFGDLESIVGQLNHNGSFIIPLAQHFLIWLHLQVHQHLPKTQQSTLSKEELADLQLWLKFLNLACSAMKPSSSLLAGWPSYWQTVPPYPCLSTLEGPEACGCELAILHRSLQEEPCPLAPDNPPNSELNQQCWNCWCS